MNYIEGLRAIAGIWVIFFHMALFASLFVPEVTFQQFLSYTPFTLAYSSSLSIDVFFIITGFVISHSLLREYQSLGKVDFLRFFLKRILRIYPLYIVILFINLPFFFQQAENLWLNIIQINNFLPRHEQYLPWAWSMAVDFQFYVIFSLFFYLVIKRKLGKVLILCYGGALFFAPILITLIKIVSHGYFWLPPAYLVVTSREHTHYVDFFYYQYTIHSTPLLLGSISAYLYVFQKKSLLRRLHQFNAFQTTLVTATLLYGIFWCILSDPIWFVGQNPTAWQTNSFWAIIGHRSLFSFLLCGLILMLAQPKGRLLRLVYSILSCRIWRPFGQLTYSSYLIHPTLILISFILYSSSHPLLSVQAYMSHCLWLFPFIYLAALLCYLYIEQPMADFLKNKWLTSPQENPHEKQPSMASGDQH